MSRVRPRQVLAGSRRSAVGTTGTIGVGPVTAGVGAVGVIIESAGAFATARGSPHTRRRRRRGRHEFGNGSSHIGTLRGGSPWRRIESRHVTIRDSMSFLVIARERYPLRICANMLGRR